MAIRRSFAPLCGAHKLLVIVTTPDILNDEDVLFHLPILAINWDNEEADALLPMIVSYCLRAFFSFASAWMEKFKQTNKKSSKGTQKQLLGSSSNGSCIECTE